MAAARRVALGDLQREVSERVRECAALMGWEGKIDDATGRASDGQRPRFLIVTKKRFNLQKLEAMQDLAGPEIPLVVWAWGCARVQGAPPPMEVGQKKPGKRDDKDAQLLRTALGSGLPWDEWLERAIRIIAPRDLLVVGQPLSRKAFPKRPATDQRTRGRDYVPLAIWDLPYFRFDVDDWNEYLVTWRRMVRAGWEKAVVPHMLEHYLTGARTIPATGEIDGVAALKRQPVVLPEKKKKKTENTKKNKSAGARPGGVNAFAFMQANAKAAGRKRRQGGYLDGKPDKRPCTGLDLELASSGKQEQQPDP